MSWKKIGNSPKAKEYIHPSGNNLDAYNSSGKESADLIQRLIPSFFKVLEYGCGTGRIMQHLKGCVVEGVDIVPEFVQECKEAGLHCSEIKDYHFNADCDIIYSITVFIHLNKKDGLDALKNIWKGLKVGGKALLQIPIYDTSKEPNSWIDVGTWTLSELKNACNQIGFNLLEINTNPGSFSYENIGKNHDAVQVLQKK